MAHFDVVDGGIPTTFTNGPKEGHLGVVTPTDGVPPRTLHFLEGLIYVRVGKRTIEAVDAHGRDVRYKGVEYTMDPRCPFAQEMRRALLEQQATQQGMEVQ